MSEYKRKHQHGNQNYHQFEQSGTHADDKVPLKKSRISSTEAPDRKEKIPKLYLPPLWSAKTDATVIQPKVTSIEGKRKSQQVISLPKVYPLQRKPSIIDEENTKKFVIKLKSQSYEYNSKKNFNKLCNLYSAAIFRYPDNPDFFCNRSYGYYKLEYYGQAVDDAGKAISIDSNYRRGYYRRGVAFVALGKFVNALKDFQHLNKLCPDNPKFNCLYLYCQQALNKSLFQVLLTENASVHNIDDLVSTERISIDGKYTGPKLKDGKPNIAFLWNLMRYYKTEGLLVHRKIIYKILYDIKNLLMALPSLIPVEILHQDDSIIICGDLNGQILNLIQIIERNGLPSNKMRYIINGNFIGRGSNCLEISVLLFTLKLVFPARFFITRGHQESIVMTKIFGFEREVIEKYSPAIYTMFTDVFKWLPLAHCINKKILVIHGGLFSEPNITLEDIREVDRFVEPNETTGLVSDIIWSDPKDTVGIESNHRGMGGILFGPDITDLFLDKNELNYIIRSHEYKTNGYDEQHSGRCVTVFSTPNYCDYGNKASYIIITGNHLERKYVNFEEVTHENRHPLKYADKIVSALF